MNYTAKQILILASVLMTTGIITAQTQHSGPTLLVQGCAMEAHVVRVQDRTFVDVQELARIANGSLSFDQNRITLTMPGCDAAKETGDDAAKSRFSGAFTKAGIEGMASIREWGGMLIITVQNGYPVGNTMAGNTIMAFQGRAADRVALASSAASTDSDHRGLELLRNEFNNVQAWAEAFTEARSSLNATNLTVSENAVKNNPEIQKLVHCGQFLAQMFADGAFRDDAACH
jgi:hypothetical protein